MDEVSPFVRQLMADLDRPRSRRASPPPDRLGDYRIHRTLGIGGMATVYLAEHLGSGERVALKVIAPHLAHHPQAAARFVAEAKAVSRIRHPNVIRILDYGRLPDDTLFQAVELLDGYELTRLMIQRRTMSAWEVQPFVHQICMGLQAAHDQGVVHRDLKPNNVFVLRDDALTLKLLDFGVAKLLDPEERDHLTVAGTVVGTPLYMAPEQALERREQIGPQTDLYALGVMVYSMLCGEPPFFHEAMGPLMLHHVEDPPPQLRVRAPRVPAAVARLVHRCLEKDPARRPASARRLAVEFARAVSADEPTVPWRAPHIRPGPADTAVRRDTVVDCCPVARHSAATEPATDVTVLDVALPDTDPERSPVLEMAHVDIRVADPPPPPLVESRWTGWIQLLHPGAHRRAAMSEIFRHAAFPPKVLAASLVLFFLALVLFAWLAWWG